MKRNLVRFASVLVLGLSVSTGFAAADTGTIGTTGPNSTNRVTSRQTTTHRVVNRNYVAANTVNAQTANSGSTSVRHNTSGGDATTGNVANDTLTSVSATVANPNECGCVPTTTTGGGMGSITLTGPDSHNSIESHSTNTTNVQNTNAFMVNTANLQSARSGSASVRGNTLGGSAASGDASNVSTTEVMLHVSN